MRIVVMAPRHWSDSGPEGCALELGPLSAVTDDLAAWRMAILVRGGRLERCDEGPAVTRDGWPAWICRATVADGELASDRIAVFYQFLDQVSFAMVSAPEIGPALAHEILETLLATRPDWTGRIVGINDLLNGISSMQRRPE